MSAPARSTAAADPLVGKELAGCILVRRLGSGALSAVYQARRKSDGAPLAIKMLTNLAARDEENIQRHRREIELGRTIRHANVAMVHDGGCANGIHYLVMELVEGATVEAVIAKRGRLPWRDAAHLLRQVGLAMAHLGGLGIIHRDIKPANILLTPGGVAKLIDLGFAKPGEDVSGAGMTMAGTAMGTPAYMPPEQVFDASSASHRSDVYGLGATFFHALTGQPPFSAPTYQAVMTQVVRAPTPDPRRLAPDLPDAIAELVRWAMDKDPAARPADADAFVRELDACVAAPQDGRRVRRLRRAQRGTWITVAAVAGGLAVCLAIAWLMLR
jgi:serine/threonine protein kinase